MEFQAMMTGALERMQKMPLEETQLEMIHFMDAVIDQAQLACLEEDNNHRQSILKKICTLLGKCKYKVIWKNTARCRWKNLSCLWRSYKAEYIGGLKMYATKVCTDELRNEIVKVEAQLQMLKDKKYKSASDITEIAMLSRYHDACLYSWMDKEKLQ